MISFPTPPVTLLREDSVPAEQLVWSLWGRDKSVALTRSSSDVLPIACYRLSATVMWCRALAGLVQAITARSLYSETLRKPPAVCLVMNQTAAAASRVCDALRLSTSIIPLRDRRLSVSWFFKLRYVYRNWYGRHSSLVRGFNKNRNIKCGKS